MIANFVTWIIGWMFGQAMTAGQAALAKARRTIGLKAIGAEELPAAQAAEPIEPPSFWERRRARKAAKRGNRGGTASELDEPPL